MFQKAKNQSEHKRIMLVLVKLYAFYFFQGFYNVVVGQNHQKRIKNPLEKRRIL